MQYVYMINNKNIVSDIKFGTIDTDSVNFIELSFLSLPRNYIYLGVW